MLHRLSLSGYPDESGEDRIRTCGPFRVTRFPSVLLKPLGHLSALIGTRETNYAILPSFFALQTLTPAMIITIATYCAGVNPK